MATTTGGIGTLSRKLNWLRAGVLGANDGIVSTAGLVMGVAGAKADRPALLIAGLAGLVAGALSMAGGEYVSVSSQKDTEIAELDSIRYGLSEHPEQKLAHLAGIYQGKGLPEPLADEVARTLTVSDALGAHAEADLGISSTHHSSPMLAAAASALAFVAGAVIPLLVMVLSPSNSRIWLTVFSVVLALSLTGMVSAQLGRATVWRAVLRNVLVGSIAMGLTYTVGHFVGPVV